MSEWKIPDVGRVSTDDFGRHGIRLLGVGYDLGLTPLESYMLGQSLVAAAVESGLEIQTAGRASA